MLTPDNLTALLPPAGTTRRLDMLLQLRSFVSEEIAQERRRLALSDENTLLEAACEVYAANVEDVLSDSRHGSVVKARQMACWLMSQQGLSTAHIGRFLNRDHTTVIYAIRRVEMDQPRRAIGRALIAQTRSVA